MLSFYFKGDIHSMFTLKLAVFLVESVALSLVLSEALRCDCSLTVNYSEQPFCIERVTEVLYGRDAFASETAWKLYSFR